MSLAIKNGPNAIAELKIPSPQDVSQGNVSLNNCKNATIGTKVDCHGNLIVNQYLNVGDSNSKLYNVKNGINGLIVTDSAAKVDWKQKILKLKYVWGSLIFAVVITAISCILFFPQRVENDSTKDAERSLNFTQALQTSQQWSKSKPDTDCSHLIERPARYVVIGHTVTPPCTNPIVCESALTAIKNEQIGNGHCDIKYNFVIGDDGYIYEGRGWTRLGVSTLSFSCNSLGIGLVGNFNINNPTDLMIDMLKLLLEEGVRLNEISPNYTIIAQSQLNNWASPGIKVEALIKTWDHWSVLNREDYECPNTFNS